MKNLSIFFSVFSMISLGWISSAFSFNFNVTTDAPAGNCTACTNPAPGTSCLLQEALDSAVCNGEGDTLNLAAGTYDASSGAANTFTYEPTAMDAENFPLTLMGAANGTSIIDGGTDARGMLINTELLADDVDADITVSGINFQNGSVIDDGGGLFIDLSDADATVQGCQFQNNLALEGGGLFLDTNDGNLFIDSSLFINNESNDGHGGGLFAANFNGLITMVNSVFAGNTASENGGGAYLNNGASSVVVTNNTLFNNTATINGGGLAVETDDSGSGIDIYNNIVWSNSADGNGDDINTCEQGATVNLFNNDFISFFSESNDGGGCGAPAPINQGANISVDPLFVDSAADNLRLTESSPAIDAGDPSAPDVPSDDFDGEPRPAEAGTNPDIGAFEYQPTPPPPPDVDPFVQGSGGCSIQKGLIDSNAQAWLVMLSLAITLGALTLRRRASSHQS